MFKNFKTRSIRIALVAAVMMSLFSVTAQAARHCNAEIADEKALIAATTIGIRPLQIECMSPYPQEVHDKWTDEMPRLLIEELENAGFKNVVYLKEGEEPEVDLIIEGTITSLTKGSAAGRILVASQASAASMSMDLMVYDGLTSEPVAECQCSRSAQGGPLGLGGLLAGSSKVIMHNHMERFAKQVTKIVVNGGNGKKDKKDKKDRKSRKDKKKQAREIG